MPKNFDAVRTISGPIAFKDSQVNNSTGSQVAFED